MNVLFPIFLAGAVAIAIPIVLHFLRRDVAPEVPFSAVRLLHRSPVERAANRRLRDLLLLAARVAALLLLAAAFARPYVEGFAGGATGVLVVAVDRSFSLGTPGRFEQALRIAREAVDGATRAERVAVIAFDDRAEVVAPPGSVADARAALALLQAGAGGTRYAAMIARAAEVAAGAAGRLVVVTDLQRAGWEDERRAALPATLTLDVRDVGPPPANLAVVDAHLGRDRVVALVRNTGPARGGSVRLEYRGERVASATFDAPADATVPVRLAWQPPAAGSVAVSVDDPEGAQADNTRYLLLDPAGRQSILVVTPPAAPQAGFYVSRALAAAADEPAAAEVLPATVMSAAEASQLSGEALAGHSAVVLLSTRGLERRTRDSLAAFVRAGGGLLVAAAPELEPEVLSAIFGWQPAASAREQSHDGVALAATDLRHPIFRPFGPLAANLGHVRFSRTWAVRAEGWDVAARFTDGSPAVLERVEGRGRVVLFASDLDRRWNDFPLQPVFVPFVVETVRYVASEAQVAREFTVAHAPAGIPAEPGVYEQPGTSRAVAINVDPRESATVRLDTDEFDAMVDRISLEPAEADHRRAGEVEGQQGLWRYGLLLMLATLVAESVVGRAGRG